MVDVSKAPPVLLSARSAGSCYYVWILPPRAVGEGSRARPSSGWIHRRTFRQSVCIRWSSGGPRADNHPNEFHRERLCHMAPAPFPPRGVPTLDNPLRLLNLQVQKPKHDQGGGRTFRFSKSASF